MKDYLTPFIESEKCTDEIFQKCSGTQVSEVPKAPFEPFEPSLLGDFQNIPVVHFDPTCPKCGKSRFECEHIPF